MVKKEIPMYKLPSPQNLSILEKIGQLFMPAAFINDTEAEVQKLEHLIRTYAIGSICFFHSRASAATNFEGKKEVVHNDSSYERLLYLIERYQKAAQVPLLMAIDAEWGLAMRIENTPQYPYAITLGALQDREDLVYLVGKGIAQDCRKAGIHWNLSPVVDINLNPENPVIGYRSFGENRNQVTEYARAYLKGMRSEGILNSIKHFPGHGDTATDSHLGLPLIDKSKAELLENELYPFVQLMEDTLDAVMVGHLSVPALANGEKIASSVSKEIMTTFLRKELKWDGIIISDALNMHAVSKGFPEKGGVEYAAFEAGNDVLCFADDIVEGIQRISEHVDAKRIESSFQRLWQLKQKVFNTSTEHSNPLDVDHNALMQQLAKESLTQLKGSSREITEFREEGFTLAPVGKQAERFESSMVSDSKNPYNTLLSIVPYQVKPKDSFGFSKAELDVMQQTLNENNTVIYLFGNPFVLNLLPWHKAKAVVIVYQDFEAFQENAVHHFKGEVPALGRLPVSLKSANR